MTRRPSFLSVLTALVIAAAMSVGCADGNSAAAAAGGVEKPDLTVSVVPAVDSAGFFIALHQGLFAAQRLHVTYVPAGSSANSIAGQASGRFDITEGNYVSYIEAQASGTASLRIIAEASVTQQNAHDIYTLPGSPIRSLDQLLGRRLAVNARSNIDYLLDASLLTENGLPPSRVHFVVVPFPRMISELRDHQIDAATLPEPFATLAEETLGATALADTDQGATQQFPIAGYVVTRTWARKYPGTLAAFLRALRQGQEIADTDRGAVEQAMEAYRRSDGVQPAIAAVMTLDTYPLDIDPVRLQRIPNIMFQFGLLPRRFGIRQMLG